MEKPRRKISATSLVADLRAGLSDRALMEKYDADNVEEVFTKVVHQ